MVIENSINSKDSDKPKDQVECQFNSSNESYSDIKTNNLNELIESECSSSAKGINQSAQTLMAQLILQTDSQIHTMVEDLADMALRSTAELASI